MKRIVIKEGKNWAENDPMLPTIGTVWRREYEFTESCLYKQTGLEGYGINEHLAAFVECMSLDKDQRLYMRWLSSLKSFIKN